ncbi:MAG: Flavin reductase like domain protein [Candidatus Argoarchaeum ethanivorans]|uniref:Flavin reductase like domain protein n=1 Tax=Candidatus Argoarchaeum ethanivorans TaxID=2608793 RepID=A0A812A0K3_9EURY|nr:MAG: Flavin reductase like domain protein [Candidatus Argoarchaeum ethanivorans]
MVNISIRKNRHSYDIIKNSGEFVINLTTKKLAYATDWCGVKSGRNYNKFKEMNLTPTKGHVVKAPLIEESPVSLECKVTEIKEIGSHSMFIAEIVAVNASEEYFDPETDEFQLYKARLITYSHGHYYEVGKHIGKFGFSVMKEKTKKRLNIKTKK